MSILTSAARSAYDIAFQVSPIIFTGGSVAAMPGGAMPIIALVGQAGAFVQGALAEGLGMEDFYARFVPMPGSTAIANTVGAYPFANQNVAANAIVRQPLTISLQMYAPVKDTAGYLTKLPLFTALQQSFASHNAAGGTYSIATPSYVYTDCIMLAMTDVTGHDTAQQQVTWQLDFIQPLISQAQASSALSSLMSKMTGGQPTARQWTEAQSIISGVPQQIGAVTQYASQAVTSLF